EGLPVLVDGDRFAAGLFFDPDERDRLKVELRDATPDDIHAAEAAVASGEVDVAISFPEGFAEGIERSRAADALDAAAVPPHPAVRFNSSRESSQIAGQRVSNLLRRWSDAVV